MVRRGRSLPSLIGPPRRLSRFHGLFHVDISRLGAHLCISSTSGVVESLTSFLILVLLDASILGVKKGLEIQDTERSILNSSRAPFHPLLSRRPCSNKRNVLESMLHMESVEDFV